MVNKINADDEFVKLVHLMRVGSGEEVAAFMGRIKGYATKLAMKICRDFSDKGYVPYNRGYVAGVMAVHDLIEECIIIERRIKRK